MSIVLVIGFAVAVEMADYFRANKEEREGHASKT